MAAPFVVRVGAYPHRAEGSQAIQCLQSAILVA